MISFMIFHYHSYLHSSTKYSLKVSRTVLAEVSVFQGFDISKRIIAVKTLPLFARKSSLVSRFSSFSSPFGKYDSFYFVSKKVMEDNNRQQYKQFFRIVLQ